MSHIFMTHQIYFSKSDFTEKQISTLHFKTFIQPFNCRILIGRLRYYVIITYFIYPNLTVFFLSHDIALFVCHVIMPFYLVPFRNS